MYNANSIRILKGIQHVHKRQQVYFKNHIPPMTELIWNVVGEAIDRCADLSDRTINVALLDDTSVEVSHDGEGYPANQYRQNQSLMRLILEANAFSGRPFKSETAAKMNIIEIGSINRVSSTMIARTTHQNRMWEQIYENGHAITGVACLSGLENDFRPGTTSIWFKLDPPTIENPYPEFHDLLWQLQFLAGFIPGIELTLHDQRSIAEIREPVLIQPCDILDVPPVHEPVAIQIPFIDVTGGEFSLELQYHHTRQPCMNAYFNGLPELELRPYLIYLLDDLLKYFNLFLHKYSDAPQNLLTLADICAGLSLDVYKRGPSSSDHRSNPGDILQGQITDSMDSLRMSNPRVLFHMIEKCLDNRRYRVSQQ